MKTSPWFRDYWLIRTRKRIFDGGANDYINEDDAFDMVGIAPDDFDLGVDEGLLYFRY